MACREKFHGDIILFSDFIKYLLEITDWVETEGFIDTTKVHYLQVMDLKSVTATQLHLIDRLWKRLLGHDNKIVMAQQNCQQP